MEDTDTKIDFCFLEAIFSLRLGDNSLSHPISYIS